MSDPKIEQIEAELRESQFTPWDVETFLANRHRAKIEALTKPENKWGRRWQTAKEAAWFVCGCVGYLTIIASAGYWLVTGKLPVERQVIVQRYDAEGLLMPPPAPPAMRIR